MFAGNWKNEPKYIKIVITSLWSVRFRCLVLQWSDKQKIYHVTPFDTSCTAPRPGPPFFQRCIMINWEWTGDDANRIRRPADETNERYEVLVRVMCIWLIICANINFGNVKFGNGDSGNVKFGNGDLGNAKCGGIDKFWMALLGHRKNQRPKINMSYNDKTASTIQCNFKKEVGSWKWSHVSPSIKAISSYSNCETFPWKSLEIFYQIVIFTRFFWRIYIKA